MDLGCISDHIHTVAPVVPFCARSFPDQLPETLESRPAVFDDHLDQKRRIPIVDQGRTSIFVCFDENAESKFCVGTLNGSKTGIALGVGVVPTAVHDHMKAWVESLLFEEG